MFVVAMHRSAIISSTATAICGPFFLCLCVFISATSVFVQNNTALHPPHMAVSLTGKSSLFKEAIKNLEFTSLGCSQCVSVSLDDLCKLIHLPSFILV